MSRSSGSTRTWRSSYLVFVAVALAPAGLWLLVLTYLTPDRLSLSMFGHHYQVHNLHHGHTAATILRFSLIAGLFLGEMACEGWRNSSVRRLTVVPTSSSRTDIAIFLVQQIKVFWALKVIATLGLVLISGAWVRQRLVDATGLNLSLSHLPLLAQVAIGYLLFTFLDYWSHRAAHTKLFWPLHRYHHSANEFCILNNSRVHPADPLGLFVVTLPIAIAQPSAEAAADLTLLIYYVRMFLHSRLRGDLGLLGVTLLQSPVQHRAHHGLDSAVHAKNFSVLPIWDHLFGTWRRSRDADIAIGADIEYRHGFWFLRDMLRDLREYLIGARGHVIDIARRVSGHPQEPARPDGGFTISHPAE